MVVSWTKADAIKLKNQNATTTTGNTTVVWKTDQKLWSMATANALVWLQQKKTPPAPVKTNNTTNITPAIQTGTTIQQQPTWPTFWTTASQQNATNPTYLDTRNTDLAKQYGTQGLKTKDQVMAELAKNTDFTNASDTDKNYTADQIFNKMQATPQWVKVDDLLQDTTKYNTLSEAEQQNPWLKTLSPEEQQAYSMMSDTEKNQFIAIGRNDLKATGTYVARWKEQQAYNKEQEANRLKQEGTKGEILDIQSGQRIRESKQSLDALKQRIAYLGNMGIPWTSTARLAAVSQQLDTADKIFAEMQGIEKLQTRLREEWAAGMAASFEKNMKDLQDALDDNVSKAMQDAMAAYKAADIKWSLDSVEKIDAFRSKLLTNLDNSITGITDDNIKARQFLIERFDNIAKEQKTYIENSNKVNKEMSVAQGIYVDGNGKAIISATTWKPIEMPEEPPMDPVYNKETGQLIVFKTWPDWGIVANVQDVWQAQWKIETIITTDDFGNEVKQSVMVYPDWTMKPVWSMWWGGMWGWSAWVGNMWWGNVMGDLRYMADKFPWQARAKNNNPAGITWNTNFDNPKEWSTAQRLINAGIQFEKGTPRPANEWWNYVSFPTMADGLAAQRIMMVGTYGNSTVNEMLQKWVGTWEWPNYAKQVAGMAGITDLNQKVGSLSQEQVETLQLAKIKKESPWLHKLLTWWWEAPAKEWQPSTQDMMMSAMWLLQGTGGTEWERGKMAQNIVKVAQRDGISIQDAKKKLWYKTKDDDEFAKMRKEQYQWLAKSSDAIMNGNRTLQLLSSTTTPITDIATTVWFLKTIDPSSVARESETRQVETARSVLDGALVYINKLKSWESLSDKQRAEIWDAVRSIVDAAEKKYWWEVTNMITEFNDRWLDPATYIKKWDIEKYTEFGQSLKGKTKEELNIKPVDANTPIKAWVPTTWQPQQPTQGRYGNTWWWGRWSQKQ